VRRIGIGIALLLVVGATGLFVFRDAATGLAFGLAMRWLAPSHGFDLAKKAPPLDYADPASWAARPETRDLADATPASLEIDVAAGAPARAVDVFFVHPTTYLKGEDWNDPLASGTSTEENTRWTLANQASVYNGCCNVYAPRYRQASIMFVAAERELGEQAMGLAYADVERAFDHFVAHLSQGRPFILAGHSQGTIHLRRLLRERISGAPLAERMVAAYLIGGGVLVDELAALPDVRACASATDLRCVVHWETYGPHPRRMSREAGATLCTNPLSWTTDETPAPASESLGAVAPTGAFSLRLRGPDVAQGIEFNPMQAPLPGYTSARCQDGILVVDDQAGTPFGARGALPGDNYHGLDYALFYMDIRRNAIARVEAFLAATGER
jgi:hypothetical protein